MKQRTPQEKKALSYAKDCRNTYGESDKGSRKTIRKNKTIQNQFYRHKVKQVLRSAQNTELENAELIESRAKSIPRGNWKKCSDLPLKFFIELRKDMSERRVGRKTRQNLLESSLNEDFFRELRKRR